MAEFDTIVCSGCGSANIHFDPQTRTISCSQCGKVEKYTRQKLNANGKVVNSIVNAKKFFLEANYANAEHYAREVLDMSVDQAPALYITAFVGDVVNKRRGNLASFFEVLKDIPIEYDELRDIMELFLSSPYGLIDYEEQVIEFIAKNADLNRDRKELSDFFDTLCPYFINKRATISSFSHELLEMYNELAAEVGIPKTVYALVSAIQKNPDSPIASRQFFLKTKVQTFYDSFMVPVGNIVKNMRQDDYKPKLQAAYNKLHDFYRTEANK